jgi:hypothetical protein
MIDGATLKALRSEFMADETSKTTQVDAAAILASIWARNALRREAQLPLLPVRATFEREVRQARWSAHVEQHYATTRTRVLDELRARHGEGFGYSVGGRWIIEAMTTQALRTTFRFA